MAESNQTRIWIQQAHSGDTLAVSKLLTVHHPILREKARARMDVTLKARLEPEDILQQVYLEVFRHIDNFEHRDPTSFLSWVLTILDHKIIDAARTLKRQKRDIAREEDVGAGWPGTHCYLLDQIYADPTTPSRVVRRDEAVGALMSCLSEVSDLHRQVIQLRFLEGRSIAHVALKLQRSEGAVVALTKRALEALRKSMDSLGDFTRC